MTEEQERYLLDLVKEDRMYQEFLCQCRELEPEYLRIRNSLSEKDRDILDAYISACENMEYCCTRLAFFAAKK